jgi:hypothetical protein
VSAGNNPDNNSQGGRSVIVFASAVGAPERNMRYDGPSEEQERRMGKTVGAAPANAELAASFCPAFRSLEPTDYRFHENLGCALGGRRTESVFL